MEFRVLGPVEVVQDGRPVVVGAARQRGLLALLLLSPNRVVRRDWLIDRLWEGNPPAAARSALQAYVYRLRKLLSEDGSPVVLGTRPAGYVLEVAADAVDAQRFESLVADGRQALGSGNLEAAMTAFRSGLGLWRGAAFADIDVQAVREAAGRLDERRLEVTEQCLSAELELGRHDSVVGELEALTARHLLRERFWQLLMLGLYRAGRQADALERYQRLYRLLDEELGIQPSRPIQELQEQILAGDPALRLSSTGRGHATPVPRQLPSAVDGLAGRSEHLACLDKLLPIEDTTDNRRPTAALVVVISGTAGVGKTALAVHWAHRVADRFGDGQLYVNLRGFDPGGQPMGPAEAVRGFLDALGIAPERIPVDLDAQAGLFRSLVAGRRMLLVLDNARDVDQVRPLLPATAGCVAVVTSRDQLSGLVAAHGAHPVVLDVLTVAEAHQLLRQRLGHDRIGAEPAAAGDIIDACSGLPLALALVAARAAIHPQFRLAELAAELRDAHSGLDALAGHTPSTDVRAVFSWSYQAVSADAGRLFRLLGLHPGPDISTAAAASLAAIPPRQARTLLAELAGAHLITEHAPGRYTLHDLLRTYAAELTDACDTNTDRHDAVLRTLDYYLHTAYHAERLISPTRDTIVLGPVHTDVYLEPPRTPTQAMTWFTTEHRTLLAALDHAADSGFDTHAWQLAWSLSNFFDSRGYWHDLAAAWRIAVDATRRLTDTAVQARALRTLARSYIELGRYDDARLPLEQSLALYTAFGDHTGRAHTHVALSYMYDGHGNHTDALAQMRLALEHFRIDDHTDGQATALNGIGWYHAGLGNFRKALTYCQQALELYREVGNRHGEASTLDSLGYAHHRLGHHRQSVDCYQQAIAICHDIGSRRLHAEILDHLGDAHHAAGDHDAARDTWQQALEIFTDLDHPDADQTRTKLNTR